MKSPTYKVVLRIVKNTRVGKYRSRSGSKALEVLVLLHAGLRQQHHRRAHKEERGECKIRVAFESLIAKIGSY